MSVNADGQFPATSITGVDSSVIPINTSSGSAVNVQAFKSGLVYMPAAFSGANLLWMVSKDGNRFLPLGIPFSASFPWRWPPETPILSPLNCRCPTGFSPFPTLSKRRRESSTFRSEANACLGLKG